MNSNLKCILTSEKLSYGIPWLFGEKKAELPVVLMGAVYPDVGGIPWSSGKEAEPPVILMGAVWPDAVSSFRALFIHQHQCTVIPCQICLRVQFQLLWVSTVHFIFLNSTYLPHFFASYLWRGFQSFFYFPLRQDVTQ